MTLLRGMFRRKATAFALVLLILLLLVAVVSPWVVPYPAGALELSHRLQSPRSVHPFGTDHFGRDILSRTLIGSRITFLLGISISLFALFFGVPIGIVSGYYDRVGLVVMRLIDALMAFPAIILALAFMAIFGRPGILNVIIALGLVWTPQMIRVVYSSTLSIREAGYIEAARALGTGPVQILLRHVAPNLLSPVIVQATFSFALSILGAAALDFLGVGIPPTIPSWGTMMNEGRMYVVRAPWIILFPGIFLALTVLSFNLLGDALRDRLDPRLRRLL